MWWKKVKADVAAYLTRVGADEARVLRRRGQAKGVDATQVEAKYANGMLEVRIPAPRAAVPRTIEVKAA